MKRLQFHLKLYQFGKVVYQTTRASKRRLLALYKAKLSSELADKAYLEVRYSRTESNAGFYSTFEDFQKAYEAFTEETLIKNLRR